MKAASQPEFAVDPAQLITDHQVGVWRYLRFLGCEDNLAEDLTQDTFLRVLQSDHRGGPGFQFFSPAATAGYLRTVARNLFVSHRRRAGREVLAGELDLAEQAWQQWVGADLHGDDRLASLKSCLEQLTERARQALRMRYSEKASRAEIAHQLEIGEHGAKNLMQRAKQQLRECMEARQK